MARLICQVTSNSLNLHMKLFIKVTVFIILTINGLNRGPLIFSAITDGTQTQHWRGGGLGRSLISLTFLFTFKSDFIARRVAIFTPGTHALAHPTSVQLLLDGLSRFWRAFPSGEARPERR